MKRLLVILAVSLFAVPALATGPGGEGTQDQGNAVCCAPSSGVEGNCPSSCDDINNGGGSPSSDDINNGGGCPTCDDYQIGGCPATDDHQENCPLAVISELRGDILDEICHKSLNRSEVIESLARREVPGLELCCSALEMDETGI